LVTFTVQTSSKYASYSMEARELEKAKIEERQKIPVST